MLFSSILFLFTFLPVTLILYYLVPGKLKNVVLLACQPGLLCLGRAGLHFSDDLFHLV